MLALWQLVCFFGSFLLQATFIASHFKKWCFLKKIQWFPRLWVDVYCLRVVCLREISEIINCVLQFPLFSDPLLRLHRSQSLLHLVSRPWNQRRNYYYHRFWIQSSFCQTWKQLKKKATFCQNWLAESQKSLFHEPSLVEKSSAPS